MFAMIFNTRQTMFADRAVRYALSLAFDFEWINKNLLQGAYVRTNSIFDNSELGARGLPEGGELALLEPHRDRLPPELFDTAYHAPPSSKAASARTSPTPGACWPRPDGALRTGRSGARRTACPWLSRSCW